MGQVAIVTGGSRGIGAAIALRLAREGINICVNYHENITQAKQVQEAVLQIGVKAIVYRANVGNELQVKKMFEVVDKELGNISVLINNAGINHGKIKIEDLALHQLEEILSTNIMGPFLCSKEAIIRMKTQGYGNIVNITSEAAKFGGNKMLHYAASKGAINAFTIGLAKEVGSYGIRVNAVSPGIIGTNKLSKCNLKSLQSIPMGRRGECIEVANVVVWLVSDQSSYVSGSIIPVTGAR